MAEVPLVDLEVIVRYSLAIRQELAPAEEVLAALDESRALVLSLLEGGGNGSGEDAAGDEAVTAGEDGTAAQDAADRAWPAARVEPPVPARDLDEEVEAAEDEVALDDLADSGAEVDGTPGLDPEPAPAPRASRRERRRAAAAVTDPDPEPEPPPVRRVTRPGSRRQAPGRPAPEPEDEDVFAPDDEDQAWVDEVERIRLRRVRKARQEADERQARQAQLAAEAARRKRAEAARRAEAERQAEEDALADEEAKRAQQERRTARGPRVGKPRAGDVGRPRAPSRPPGARRAAELDDALELPPPLPADEAARRREERRRRRAQG